jgi:hypothetical protein
MDQQALIADALDRGRGVMRRAIGGVAPGDLGYRPDPHANPLGWLAWHVGRVEDMHVADLMDVDQLWTADGWHERFGMDAAPGEFGTGQTLDEVDAVPLPTADTLLAYLEAVWSRTDGYVGGLTPNDLDRVLDEPQFTPRPTVGVRLVSLIHHVAHHGGQPTTSAV